MQAAPVIEALDVVAHVGPGVLARLVVGLLGQFALQRREGALDRRIYRKRSVDGRLPARAVIVLGRPGAGSFGLTLWSTLMTTCGVAGTGGSRF